MARLMEATAVLGTDAGSWLVWQHDALAHIHDYESWSSELEEDSDVLRHVRAGVAVPISIGSDGAFSFRVRVGRSGGRLTSGAPAALTEREEKYLLVSSDPYLLISHGRVVVSGIEHVGAVDPVRQLAMDVPQGRWVVTAHVIAWDDEPGATSESGQPTPQALSDFVVLLNPELRPASEYAQSLTPIRRG